MRTAIILIAVLSFSDLAFSDTIYVPDDYAKIQEAIDIAVNGDTVVVRSGTYIENIDFKGKAITVQSEQGANDTIIDGNQSGSVVTCQGGEGPDSVLDGFTITNGLNSYDGGGMYNKSSSPTVKNCTFSENYARNGGGIHNLNSNPTVTGCLFTQNYAYLDGGGISNNDSSPTVKNCTFSENYTYGLAFHHGGGMFNWNSNPTVTECLFIQNLAQNHVNLDGGGMYNRDSNPTVKNCTFSENYAVDGGGMYNWYSNLTLTNCTFFGNSSSGTGGGMYNYVSNLTLTNCTFFGNSSSGNDGGMYNYVSNLTLTNCTFFGNSSSGTGGGISNNDSSPTVKNCTFSGNSASGGGGMFNYEHSSPTLTNCTFSGNSSSDTGGGMNNVKWSNPTLTNCTFFGNASSGNGGGMFNWNSNPTLTNCTFFGNSSSGIGSGMFNDASDPTVTNCILWNDTIVNYYGSSPTIRYCCIQGGYPGIGNIDLDPLFVDEADADFHLTYPSPCRGTGATWAVKELYDFEGDPRIVDFWVDMGADEFYTHFYVTGDKTPGGKVVAKFVGLPGTTPVGLWFGSGIYDPPLQSMFGPWYLEPPCIGPVILNPIPSPEGVLILPATIHREPPPPYDIFMQALIGLNSDSLTNLFVLEVR